MKNDWGSTGNMMSVLISIQHSPAAASRACNASASVVLPELDVPFRTMTRPGERGGRVTVTAAACCIHKAVRP